MGRPLLDNNVSAPQYWHFCRLSKSNTCPARWAANRFHASSASDRRFEIAASSFAVGRLDRLICSVRRTYFMIRSQRIESRTEQIWHSIAVVLMVFDGSVGKQPRTIPRVQLAARATMTAYRLLCSPSNRSMFVRRPSGESAKIDVCYTSQFLKRLDHFTKMRISISPILL
jgi:hypothetical protein